MNGSRKVSFEFGDYRLIPDEQMLLKNGVAIQLPNKAFGILVVLVENAGELVEKQQLLEFVWKDSFVEEANIQVHISAIRKALNEKDNGKFVETVPKRGYRFTSSVRTIRYTQGNGSLATEEETAFSSGDARETLDPAAAARVTPRPSQKRPRPLILPLALIAVALSGIGAYWLIDRGNPFRNFSSQTMKFTRLTQNGKAYHAAISPDGNSIVYKLVENGLSSFIAKDILTGTETQILPPSEALYDNPSFSPDGKSIFYTHRNPNDTEFPLYKLPAHGGTPKRIATAGISHHTISPEGDRIAFTSHLKFSVRADLIIASIDGGNEQHIITERPIVRPAWKPDGTSITFFEYDEKGDDLGNHYQLKEVNLEDRSEKILSPKFWGWISDLRWVSDGSGLVFVSRGAGRTDQIHYLTLSNGEERRLTNDANDYSDISISADSGRLVAVQREVFTSIWLTGADGNINNASPIITGANQDDGWFGVGFTPNNRIVFAANENQNYMAIWSMNTDGSDRKMLTHDGVNRNPTVAPDGQSIVFGSFGSDGRGHIRKMDIDGGNLKQLAHDHVGYDPAITPDGKWILYTSLKDKERRLRIMKVDGGDSHQLSDLPIQSPPAVSPDGRLIAFAFPVEKAQKIALISIEGGNPLKMLDSPMRFWPGIPFKWTKDGHALTYIDCKGRTCNLWNLPIDGSPPVQVTNFTSQDIKAFDWSRDGKQLVIARSYETNNAVMISDFR